MAGRIQQYLCLPVLSGRLKDKRLQKEKHKLETVRKREKDRELHQHTRADFIRDVSVRTTQFSCQSNIQRETSFVQRPERFRFKKKKKNTKLADTHYMMCD